MNGYEGLQLHSTVTLDGRLQLTLDTVQCGAPDPDEIIVRVEATPINPSDLGLLFGPADLDTLEAGGSPNRPTLIARIPDWATASVAARRGLSMPVGNEGAGTVVAAGSNVQRLLGKRVGMMGGGMYAQFRQLPARDCIVLPDDVTTAHGAAMFVNPLTALGFVETMKTEKHTAIVHFAAASNLGQMLQRICLMDGIPLVNIVRRPEQVEKLLDIGATHVIDSSKNDYEARLIEAIADTGATIAFDPIGGGRQAATALYAMEKSVELKKANTSFSRYGSDTFKQVYIYGALDLSPTILDRWVGFSWNVGGWLLTPFLQKIGAENMSRLKQRVSDQLTTTFQSHYTKTISLAEALDPTIVLAYHRKATGEKYLIDPSR